MRSEGTPITAPTAAAMAPPAGSANQNGALRRVIRLAAVYAPTDISAPWPIEIWPV